MPEQYWPCDSFDKYWFGLKGQKQLYELGEKGNLVLFSHLPLGVNNCFSNIA